MLRRGGSPYLPDGEALARTEPAIVVTEWLSLRRDRSLRTLRRLLETPHFAVWLGALCDLSQERMLAACDALILERLAETITDEAIPPKGIRDTMVCADAMRLQYAVLREFAKGATELVAEIWKLDPGNGSRNGLEEVLDVCGETSPVLRSWPDPEKAQEASLVRALARSKKFGASKLGDLELSGWLEAPWSEAKRLVLAGCTEGFLPASTDGHPFLPDQKRSQLGIPDNATRRARDAYLLGCLVRTRGVEHFRCSFAKFGPDGSPSVPSTLLMRCPEEVLPVRVLALFGKSPSVAVPTLREHDWKWNLPLESEPLQKINVTDFASYLMCPFRFYLRRLLKLKSHDPDQREMDPMQFGILVHSVLERYGQETPDLSDREEIAAAVLSSLEQEIMQRFGADPSPVVRVQAEAARVRLLSFATVQASQVAQGWRIKEVEYKSSGDLLFGGLPLSAMIDRVEENGDRVRVLDYKTYTSMKKPEEVHLHPPSRAFLPEAKTMLRGKPKAWVDLQLPLYRKIAEQIYPGKTIESAYLVLAADPEESDVIAFDLPEDLLNSAMSCAEASASAIARGVFWPPQQVPKSWEDPLGVFLSGGSPEECLDANTVAFLKGKEVSQ